jgi:rubrerythrin
MPGLTITMTPLDQSTEVQISKVSTESVMEAVKDGGQKLLDLIQDGFHLSKNKQDVGNLFDIAGLVLNDGVDIMKTVKDLNIEDKAWETIKRAADPLQQIFDDQKAIENARLLKLENAWDDFYTCPKCRVPFGQADNECRVCGTARPEKPAQPDPRGIRN